MRGSDGVALKGYDVIAYPNVWKIMDIKLYLDHDASVESEWRKDDPGIGTS